MESSPSMGWERWIGMLSIPQSVQNGQFLRSLYLGDGSSAPNPREPEGPCSNYSHLIIALAAKYRLPAVYPNSSHVARGGLVSYGPSVTNEYKRAAGYVDRILRGDKPTDLPVQRAVLYETVLNLKTAAALGLKVPPIVYARVDQIIE